MSLNEFLVGALVYLAAAVISAPLAKRAGLDSVLGFLAAGALIGPAALGIVGSEGEAVKHFAEFGVIVMLFLVGLELEPEKLWNLRRHIFGLGLAQVVTVALAVGALSLLVSSGWRESVAIGLILALSSTAIVLKSLQEKGLLKTKVGQSVFSVLLFQDIAVIPILALLPLIAVTQGHGEDGHSASLIGAYPVWAQALLTIGAVAVVLVVGRYVMRPIFRFVAETGAREIFVAFALLLVVAITLLMGLVGLSAALGTFLAGVVLADSEYRHELEMDLEPFKGLLLAIFFIAVGSGIDFSLFKNAPALLLIGLIVFILIKLAIHFGLAKAFGMNAPDQSRFSFSLAQGSEFGFVLITFALGLGLLAAQSASLLTAIIALSMAAAPLLMKFEERVMQQRFVSAKPGREADTIVHDGTDVIIAGHGRFGMTIGRLLRAQGFRCTVLDHDSEQVEVLRKFGFAVFYGDALRLDLLEAAGAKEAKVLIIAIDDHDTINQLIDIAQHNYPNLKILSRAYDRAHAYEVIRSGVTHVYREVIGSSMDLARDALVVLGKSAPEADRVTTLFRQHDEKFLRKAAELNDDQTKLIDLAKQSRAEIANVFAQDQSDKP
jgi:monovalent cation:proton antiporter-2 (CPA2) family protein